MLWERHSVAAFLTYIRLLHVSLVSLTAALLFLAHRWRVRVVEDRMRRFLVEQIAARERLSRRRNDDLLQGMQGLILLFQGIAVQIPAEIWLASQLESALDRAERLMIEARDGLAGLCFASDLARPPRILNADAVGAIFRRILSRVVR